MERVQIKHRIPEWMRNYLRKEAQHKGVSLSDEIAQRLNQTISTERRVNQGGDEYWHEKTPAWRNIYGRGPRDGKNDSKNTIASQIFTDSLGSAGSL